MIPSPALLDHATCSDGLISRYEELRAQALGPPSDPPRGEGLAALMRGGMSAWMRAWAPRTLPVPVAPQLGRVDEDIFPLEMHKEVAMILAGMVLYGRQGAFA